ncbi:MAG: mechanosensitive ion channel family protein [Actinomycetota bacterium]|nr:mechanosensitive ion channel family protein [Actinomycetota bacterium]
MPMATPTEPSPALSLGLSTVMDNAEAGCDDNGTFCNLVTEVTGNKQAGLWTELLLGSPLKVLCIVLLGLFARFLIHKITARVAEGITSGRVGLGKLDDRAPTATAFLTASPILSARREQRAKTTASLINSIATGAIAAVMILMIMQVFGLPITPLLASAGILGVAFGFGSQSLVKDFLSGIFMIIEDQYGVGDIVDLGEASGTVEAVGLRVTRLRDVEGTAWYLRNGEILRVGNRSQGWARAVLDVGVAYGENVERAQRFILDEAEKLQQDQDYSALILEDPEVWGVESVSADGVVVRLVVKTAPMEQWKVARELRIRIKKRFDAEGVHVAYSQNAVWLQNTGAPAPSTPMKSQAGGSPDGTRSATTPQG